MPINYVNTDLDLESIEDLTELVDAFGGDVIVLHNRQESDGRYTASLEIAGLTGDADSTVSRFCSIIEALPENAKSAWESCSRRSIDMAFESGEEPLSFHSELQEHTMTRISNANLALVVTVYPVGAYGA